TQGGDTFSGWPHPYVCFMKLYELTTGVIAAVLIALGAYQYVNKTTVEEEPVVLDEIWYKYVGPTDANYLSARLEAESYEPYVMDPNQTTPDCEIGSFVCAIKLPENTSEDHPTQSALDSKEAEILAGNPVTDEILFRN